MKIERVAVIGAGTMGAGIASHLANAGVPVLLLDVAGDGPQGRDAIAAGAIERQLRASPPAFMDRAAASLVTPGNVEDHLDRVAECDWIAEAVVERLDVKHDLYRALERVRRPGSLISSNTSTIPLAMLLEGMPDSFASDFCITHFFNPVRYMRLLELVSGPRTRPEVTETLATFCDRRLGKGVVRCGDTPGFLGNRVGVFALQVGIVEAAANGLTVEEADAVMGRPMGIPKTGVFGLYDLIGLDLMLDVNRMLAAALPDGDAFHEVAEGIPLVHRLVAEGHTGDKGGAGFYRNAAGDDGVARREAVDLESGEYRAAQRPLPAAAVDGERDGLRALLAHDDACGRFARRVLARTLGYAASLVPAVTPRIADIDEAMRLGFNWARGPFEMIDAIGTGWLCERLAAEGIAVPPLLEAAVGRALYRVDEGRVQALSVDGAYRNVERPEGAVRLRDLMPVRRAMLENDAASVWDVGDGVACFEFHTKANALVPATMDLLRQATAEVGERGFRALLVHNDAPHFSVGVNLEWLRAAAADGDWARVERMLAEFQSTCSGLRYAPFPVVAAPGGTSLGGGFEVVVHCDAVQMHANTVLGAVETLVGLVPGGGGCTEVLRRWTGDGDDDAIAGAVRTFELVGTGRTASSPQEARRLRFLRDGDGYTMSRDRLLSEAKMTALALADDYAPPAPLTVRVPGAPGREAMLAALADLEARGVTTPHDHVVGAGLARILCGGDPPGPREVPEPDLHALEREVFLELLRTPATRARIDHLLAHGRPLRN